MPATFNCWVQASVSILTPREAECDLGDFRLVGIGHGFQSSLRARRSATLSAGAVTHLCDVSILTPREAECDAATVSVPTWPRVFQSSLRARRSATLRMAGAEVRADHVSILTPREAECDRQGPAPSTAMKGFNPHSARGGVRPGHGGHDGQHRRGFQSSLRARRSATFSTPYTSGALSPFQSSLRARRSATWPSSRKWTRCPLRFNPHSARGGVRRWDAICQCDYDSVSILTPREAECDDHRGTAVIGKLLVSILTPREAECDRKWSLKWHR